MVADVPDGDELASRVQLDAAAEALPAATHLQRLIVTAPDHEVRVQGYNVGLVTQDCTLIQKVVLTTTLGAVDPSFHDVIRHPQKYG